MRIRSERAPDPADRRRNVVTITAEGGLLLDRLDALLASLQDDLLAPLAEPERRQLVELLTRLVEHHARATPPEPGG